MGKLKWIDSKATLAERLRIAKKSTKFDPCCHSTSFFFLGVLPYDVVIFDNDNNKRVRKALSRMIYSAKPVDKSLLVSFGKSGSILHSAYILTAKPFFGYHRTGSRGSLEAIYNIKNIEEYLIEVDEEDFSVVNNKAIWSPHEMPYKHKFYILNPKDNLKDWAKAIIEEYEPGWDM